jgi:hypothetical protein
MYVKRFDRRSLVWAMEDLAAPHLSSGERTWLCVQIGAGDLEHALITLVGVCARRGIFVPGAVRDSLRDWLRGYTGTAVAEELAPYLADARHNDARATSTQEPTPSGSGRYGNRLRGVDRLSSPLVEITDGVGGSWDAATFGI